MATDFIWSLIACSTSFQLAASGFLPWRAKLWHKLPACGVWILAMVGRFLTILRLHIWREKKLQIVLIFTDFLNGCRWQGIELRMSTDCRGLRESYATPAAILNDESIALVIRIMELLHASLNHKQGCLCHKVAHASSLRRLCIELPMNSGRLGMGTALPAPCFGIIARRNRLSLWFLTAPTTQQTPFQTVLHR
ncbi:MAG: hypothetical protein Q9P14_16805 [candidate division KSB1 bacterium]|nr:hypothetical protein [candidate division KSB1 bacterium]